MPNGQVRHAFAQGGDFAGNVAARNMGEWNLNAGNAGADEEIQVIQGAGANAHHDFSASGNRIRSVFITQHVGTTVLVHADSFH